MEAKFLDEKLKETFAGYGVVSNEEAETVIYQGTSSHLHEIINSICYLPFGGKQCLMIDAMRLEPEEVIEVLKHRCHDLTGQCA